MNIRAWYCYSFLFLVSCKHNHKETSNPVLKLNKPSENVRPVAEQKNATAKPQPVVKSTIAEKKDTEISKPNEAVKSPAKSVSQSHTTAERGSSKRRKLKPSTVKTKRAKKTGSKGKVVKSRHPAFKKDFISGLSSADGRRASGALGGTLSRINLSSHGASGYTSRATTSRPRLGKRPAWLSAPKSQNEHTHYGVNEFIITQKDKLSTFSVDVDTASYTFGRRRLMMGVIPRFESVRAEEYINYFNYDYSDQDSEPFQVHLESMPDPFDQQQDVFRVGIQSKRLNKGERPPLRLTFLVDVSGSMRSADKLPLAVKSLHMLVDTLQDDDSVAIVTYASQVERVLSPTYGDQRKQIHQAIDKLRTGGGTAMSSGLQLAYEMAWKSFKAGAENRVVVLSDGDANLGKTSWKSMLQQIKSYADRGVTLSTIGFGMGNYKDTRMEQLANQGDGNNYYVDTDQQAKRLFVDGFNGTMITVARDVKIQVEFNPKVVQSYRLIGYENRQVADKHFRNDQVDAGEVGAGHSVTALYKLVRHRKTAKNASLATVRLRYEEPGENKSAQERTWVFRGKQLGKTVRNASKNLRVAYSAGLFAEHLRRSSFVSHIELHDIERFAQKAARANHPDDQELIALIRAAKRVRKRTSQR